MKRHDAALAEGNAISATGADLPGDLTARQADLERAILDMPAAGFRSLAVKATFVKRCRGLGLWIETEGEHLGDVEALIADIEQLASA